ncbi:hypothetical protein BDF19DRAFT_420688 [Syncephalis fuscata]|nr:hypothetical protein BDF19DRAFT_420688 [Syncephalis fuscata]
MALNIVPLVATCIYTALLALPICYFYRHKKLYVYLLLALLIFARITASVIVLFTDINASPNAVANAEAKSNFADPALSSEQKPPAIVNKILRNTDSFQLASAKGASRLKLDETLSSKDTWQPQFVRRQFDNAVNPAVQPPPTKVLTLHPIIKPTVTPPMYDSNTQNNGKKEVQIVPMVEWSDAIQQLSTSLLVLLNLLLLRWWALSTKDELSSRVYAAAKGLYYAALPVTLIGTILYISGTALLIRKIALAASQGTLGTVYTLDASLMQMIGAWLVTICLLTGLTICIWMIVDYSNVWAIRGDIVERKRLQIKILLANIISILPIVAYHLILAHVDPIHTFITMDIRIILPSVLALLPTAGWCWPGVIFKFQTGFSAGIIGK